MTPNRRGVFQGAIAQIGVAPNKNNLITVTIHHLISEEVVAGEAVDVAGEDLDIINHYNIEQKNGSLNEINIKQLKQSLGWDGRDVVDLQTDPKFVGMQVQTVLDFEEYEGRTRLRVKFLNPYGWAGAGVVQSSPEDRKAISSKLGPKLRALAGPAARPTAARPAATPASAAAPASPAPASPATARPAPSSRPRAAVVPSPATATKEEAWASFARCNTNITQENLESEWSRLLTEMFPDGEVAMTPADWAKFAAEAPAKVIPF